MTVPLHHRHPGVQTTSLLGFLFWTLVAVALLSSPVAATLPTAALDIALSDVASDKPSSHYTILVSQASFGSYPSMERDANPVQTLRASPADNPFLCDPVVPLDPPLPDNTVLLVPRGTCTFERKALHAQNLGAQGVVIYGTLAMGYRLNSTTTATALDKNGKKIKKPEKTAVVPRDYTMDDVEFPTEFVDYDCRRGQANIPLEELSFDPLPYNAAHNDRLLIGDTSDNLCLKNSGKRLRQCESKACFLTGTKPDADHMQACCAWDLPMWLGSDLNAFNGTEVDIPAVYVTIGQGFRLLREIHTNSRVSVRLYARWRPEWNPASLLIWALGVSVAALAAYSSAGDYRRYTRKLIRRQRERDVAQEDGRSPRQGTDEEEIRIPVTSEESMELTIWHAVGFIVMASTSLLILFYLKIYSLVKIMYGFGCSKAVSDVLFHPLLHRIMKKLRIRNRVHFRIEAEDIGNITTLDIASHIAGYSLGLAWLTVAIVVPQPHRLAFYWIAQDVFGACMCVIFLQVIKLNSLQVAAVLLLCAFVYDIFFVFISPLFFKKSVMLDVATSGGPPPNPDWCEKYPRDAVCRRGDPLPMLLAIPRLFDYQGGMSMLGLGDIVIPGLLLSLAARLDAAKSLLGVVGGGSGSLQSYGCPERSFCGSKIYSGGYLGPVWLSYCVGLIMANLAVYWMEQGQPALLYLVPCCLGTMMIVAWSRRELSDLWHGSKSIRAADMLVYGESSVPPDHTPVPQGEEQLDEFDPLSVPSAQDDLEEDPPQGVVPK